ncbi:MAG: F0F1 ATP synthase subunit B [Patescibacteria group bacterium]
MDSFITTFHIDWKILIAQGINFAIVLLLLYFFALKPLKKVMSERTNVIEKGIADAKHNAELVTKTTKEYEEVIGKAKAEAHTLFQEGKKEAEVKKAEMMASAQAEVESMIATGKKNLETEKNKMVEEAKVEIVSLVVAATEKILKDQGDKSVTEKAIKNINHI